jgi:hypothetical protein
MVKHNAGACSKLLQSFSPLAALLAAQTIIVPVPVDKSILCFPGGAWFSGCAGLLMRPGGLVAIRVGSIRQFAAWNDKIAIQPSLKFSVNFR